MKRLFIFVFFAGAGLAALAQTAKPKTPAKAPVKPAPAVAKPALKNLVDSASYAMGIGVASFYKQQGITNINTALLAAAIDDIMKGKPTQMNEVAANDVMNKLMNNILEAKSKPNIDACNSFLATNKTKPGIKTTESGLQYEVLQLGTGIRPTAQDTFVCHYRGTLLNGTEFDASYNRNQPLEMPMNQVIRGWTEGLSLMPVGSKYKFYIPYTLGYGANDNGPIPGGSLLIFEVELLDVKKAQ